MTGRTSDIQHMRGARGAGARAGTAESFSRCSAISKGFARGQTEPLPFATGRKTLLGFRRGAPATEKAPLSPAVANVLRALGDSGLRQSADGWTARCPAHDDRNPSLSISEGSDGKALILCRAGCVTADVARAVGLTMADLMPSRDDPSPHLNGTQSGASGGKTDSGSHDRIAATYDYLDERRALLYQVVRYDPKGFRQRRPDGSGGWTWKLGDARRVLYRLPELQAAMPDAPVFIVEGEKDADNLARLRLIATTNSGGAGKWRDEYGEVLRGRQVVILPDSDEPGHKHAWEVARALAGVAASVKVLELPAARKGRCKRLDRRRRYGHRTARTGRGSAGLSRSADGAGPDGRPQHRGPRGLGMGRAPRDCRDPAAGPRVRCEVLPGPIGNWVADAADRTQCPPEYSAAAAVVALGSIIGRGVTIRPKQNDDWTVVSNLWGAGGRPGTLKSPALAEALRHVRHLEAEAHEQTLGNLRIGN